MIKVIETDTTTLLDAAKMATAAHLFLITKGDKTVLSPVVPQGWAKVGGGNLRTKPINEVRA